MASISAPHASLATFLLIVTNSYTSVGGVTATVAVTAAPLPAGATHAAAGTNSAVDVTAINR